MSAHRTATVQSQFGRAAADYAVSDVHAKGESLTRIVELAKPEPTWKALDVATGAGHMAAAFAPHVASIVASDVTAEMLAQAAKLAAERGLGNVSTAAAEAGSLPFEDGAFDLVCCRLAAHHFPSLDKFVAEVKRVLKPGGRFALVDNVAPDQALFPDASAHDLADAVDEYNSIEKLRDPSHGFAPPPGVWIDLLEKHGFVVVAREQFAKEMAFDPWVTRMRVAAGDIAKLRIAVGEPPPLLKRFFRPRRDESGALHFSLQEFLVVADAR